MSKATKKHPRHNWRSFEEARAFVRGLGLKDQHEWFAWTKTNAKPDDIPADPRRVYKDAGWTNLGDWLGTHRRKGGFRPIEKARKFVRKLSLKDHKSWTRWAKSDLRPKDIPSNPNITYKSTGWLGWGDWLGTGQVSTHNRIHLPFHEAREFVHGLGLKSYSEWNKWAKSDKRPNNIPINPRGVYKKEWTSVGDWLGTNRVAPQKMYFRPFDEARKFIHSQNLQSKTEWSIWAKSINRPDDIPANPPSVYKNKGWVNWGDWLGTGRIATFNYVYRSFEEARKFVHEIGIQKKR